MSGIYTDAKRDLYGKRLKAYFKIIKNWNDKKRKKMKYTKCQCNLFFVFQSDKLNESNSYYFSKLCPDLQQECK